MGWSQFVCRAYCLLSPLLSERGYECRFNPAPVDAARYGSAGNLHSTAKEYAKFLVEIIDPKPEDAFRLSAASLHEMLRPQVKITDTLSWGLGWAIEQHPGMGHH